jgi:hypothetical protein
LVHTEGGAFERHALFNGVGNDDPSDQVAEFTPGLLRAGLMLSGLAADLTEDLHGDAYPGEEPAAVVIEMITGTIRTALDGAEMSDLEQATALIGEACDRVIEHLELALELARRMHGTPDGERRTYG